MERDLGIEESECDFPDEIVGWGFTYQALTQQAVQQFHQSGVGSYTNSLGMSLPYVPRPSEIPEREDPGMYNDPR